MQQKALVQQLLLAIAFGGLGLVAPTHPASAACAFGPNQFTPIFDSSTGLIRYCNGSTITNAALATTAIAAGGSTTQLQFNNAGALAGTANMTWTTGTNTLTVTGIVAATTFSGSGASLTNIPTSALTGALAAAQFPALTGDVTTSAGNVTTTIANGAVTNAKLATMAANSLKGNNTGSAGAPLDLTAAQATAMLNAVVGDSGSGGTKGLVPAPAAGDSAASKFLKADGTWVAINTSPTTISQADSNVAVADTGAGTITFTIDGVARITGAATGITTTVPLLASAGAVGAPSYSFSGDANTGIYSAGADQIGFAANGVNRLTVDATGATVTGTLTATTFSGSGASLTNIPVTALSGTVTNAQLATMAANTIKGNNTGSTGAPLDLTAAQATAMLNAVVGDSGSGGTKGLVPAPAAGDSAASKFLKADGTWAAVNTSPTTISQGDSNVTVTDAGTGSVTVAIDGIARATFNATGLGLGGTPLTSRRLTVQDTGQAARLALAADTNQNTVLEFFENGVRRSLLSYDTTANRADLLAEEAGSQVALWTANTERLRIDASGNVGIGTTSPSERLDVVNSAGTSVLRLASNGNTSSIQVNANTTSNAAAELVMGGATTSGNFSDIAQSTDAVVRAEQRDLILAARNATGNIDFTTGASDTLKMTLLNNGRLGLGVSAPTQLLHLASGAIRFTADSTTACDADAVGAIRFNGTDFEQCKSPGSWATLASGSGATSVTLSGWPDFIMCDSGGTLNKFDLFSYDSSIVMYRTSAGNVMSYSRSTGNLSSGTNGFDCKASNWSMSQVAANGRAFYVGGSGVATAAGGNGQIQFNNGSNAFSASTNLAWDIGTNTLTAGGSQLGAASLFIAGASNVGGIGMTGSASSANRTALNITGTASTGVITNIGLRTGNVDRLRLDDTGGVSIGSGVDAASSAILDVTSTTKGFLPPRMSTTQRNAISAPAAGLTIYNTTTSQIEVYSGSAWGAVGSSSGGGGIQTAVSTAATSGAACSTLGELGKDVSGNLFVCDDTPSTLSGGTCASFGAGALTIGTDTALYYCSN